MYIALSHVVHFLTSSQALAVYEAYPYTTACKMCGGAFLTQEETNTTLPNCVIHLYGDVPPEHI